MKLSQLKKLLETRRLPDQWWVAVDGNIREAYENLHTIEALLQNEPDSTIAVLHVSESDNENAQWTEIERVQAKPKVKVIVNKTAAGASQEAIQQLTEAVQMLSNQFAAFDQRLASVEESVKQIEDFKALFAEVIGIEKVREDIERRREFIEESERQLLNKTYDHDVRSAELEQAIEDKQRRASA